ncbi:hypothetical protein MG293_009326 [Ovis ammon polii]|uniref:Ig-like domain-containing protein n=1 Tax=Ovis ammon polii TaxID=230172 RepID=A0AAD4U9X4_OVIAM|nr:hypothetical protein MG293_009326 [Ovis ammon polii]
MTLTTQGLLCILRPQTQALASVLCSVVLPKHLQPCSLYSYPPRGSAPPPATVTPRRVTRYLYCLVFLTYTGSGVAQRVIQDQPDISSQLGQSVTLNCRYGTTWSSYYVFWYKLLPSGEMIYLIRQVSSGQNARNGRYSVHFQKAREIIQKRLHSISFHCSAMLLLLISILGMIFAPRSIIAQKVTQDPQPMLVQEKEAVTLDCTYDTSDSSYSLFWYKQPSSGAMIFLLRQDSYGKQNAAEGVSLGNKVEQSPSTLSVQEGNSSVITCTYTDTASAYFPWYKQEPGKGLQLLIAIRSNKDKEEDQRLTVLLNKTAKRLSLHIAATEAGDSAVYFCAAGSSIAQKVTQDQPPMSVQEKENVTLDCTYDISITTYSLFWYKQPSSGVMTFLIRQDSSNKPNATEGQTRGDSVSQMDGQVTLLEGATLTVNCTYSAIGYPTLFWYVQYAGEAPELLLKATKANDKGTNKGFEATYDAKTTSFHLEKASVQESDSAVYHCALSDTVRETAGGAEHKL